MILDLCRFHLSTICHKIVLHKPFVDFSLQTVHFGDDYLALFSSHLFDLLTLYLVLGHVGDLEHHAWVLKVRAYGVHFLIDLHYAVALEQFFLHQMENGQRDAKQNLIPLYEDQIPKALQNVEIEAVCKEGSKPLKSCHARHVKVLFQVSL